MDQERFMEQLRLVVLITLNGCTKKGVIFVHIRLLVRLGLVALKI